MQAIALAGPGGEELWQTSGVALNDCRGLRETTAARGIIPMIGYIFQRVGHLVEEQPPGLHRLSSGHCERGPGTEHNNQYRNRPRGRAESLHNITLFFSKFVSPMPMMVVYPDGPAPRDYLYSMRNYGTLAPTRDVCCVCGAADEIPCQGTDDRLTAKYKFR